jgi:hypothetical protein
MVTRVSDDTICQVYGRRASAVAGYQHVNYKIIRNRLANLRNESTLALQEGLPKIGANIFEKSRQVQVDSVVKLGDSQMS